jgi:ABC-type polar amino acid transport system ATPase subunit
VTLKVRDLVRHHPGAAAPTLAGVSLELGDGVLAAVLGPSGAGKSTLLRCVMGLEPFEAGAVEVDGVVVQGTRDVTPARRRAQLRDARARLGLVFQSFELFPHLTALENCTLAPRTVKGRSGPEATATVMSLLAQLGLEAKRDAYPAQLSGGQRQRVAIARALAMAPRVLLYDEPTSALDPSMKGEVLQALRRVEAAGVTQVVVTHDLSLARGVAHLCVLDRGVIVEAGAPARVLEAPAHPATRALLRTGA